MTGEDGGPAAKTTLKNTGLTQDTLKPSHNGMTLDLRAPSIAGVGKKR